MPKKKVNNKPTKKRGRKSKASKNILTEIKVVNNKKLEIDKSDLNENIKSINLTKKKSEFIILVNEKNKLLERLETIDEEMSHIIQDIIKMSLKYSSLDDFFTKNNIVMDVDNDDDKSIKYDKTTENDNSDTDSE